MRLKRVRTPRSGDAQRPWARRPLQGSGRVRGDYRAMPGEVIDVWPLQVQGLRAFVAAGRGFHAWRRQARGTPDGGPAGSEDGTGMDPGNG